MCRKIAKRASKGGLEVEARVLTMGLGPGNCKAISLVLAPR